MTDPRETFGPLDCYHAPIIGLTGRRGVGKTTAAEYLASALGFVRAHAFAGGKAATRAYFEHLGADPAVAYEMVHGRLRDAPSPLLPDDATPRFFMEKFGRFMGQDLGDQWTLGAEIARLRRDMPGLPIVVESVVYEADSLRRAGGLIIRIVRPGYKGAAGIETDAAQAGLDADVTITNDGDIATLCRAVTTVAQGLIGGS